VRARTQSGDDASGDVEAPVVGNDTREEERPAAARIAAALEALARGGEGAGELGGGSRGSGSGGGTPSAWAAAVHEAHETGAAEESEDEDTGRDTERQPSPGRRVRWVSSVAMATRAKQEPEEEPEPEEDAPPRRSISWQAGTRGGGMLRSSPREGGRGGGAEAEERSRRETQSPSSRRSSPRHPRRHAHAHEAEAGEHSPPSSGPPSHRSLRRVASSASALRVHAHGSRSHGSPSSGSRDGSRARGHHTPDGRERRHRSGRDGSSSSSSRRRRKSNTVVI